ncbi:MAG: hypothetical protein SchgKO_04720 [Schleiferiaceae bacterium]
MTTIQPTTQWGTLIAIGVSAAICTIPGIGVLIVFILLILALLMKRVTWNQLGFTTPESWPHLFFKSVWVGVALQLISFYGIEPAIVYLTGEEIDLSSFTNIQGNITYLFLWLLFVWGVVIFVEEIVFRGWLYHSLVNALPAFRFKKLLLALGTSALFGLAHFYQGPSGMLATGIMSFALVGCFEWERRTIWFPIIVHGIIDTVGLLFIYFDWMPL